MKYSYNLSGANQQLIKEFDIDPEKAIKKGQPVTFEQNKVTDISDAVSAIAGVAEEDHSGVKEELNSRSNGTKIRLSISPSAVYTAKLKTFEVTGDGFGSFYVTKSQVDADFLNNHQIVFVEMGKNSATMLPLGSVLNIHAAHENTSDLYVEVKEISTNFCLGDKYLVIPKLGEKLMSSVSGEYLYPKTPEDSQAFVCVGVDIENQTIDAKVYNSYLD